jgi:DNA-binding transcriptional MocR family regulator
MARILTLFVPRRGRVLVDPQPDPALALALVAHGARVRVLQEPESWSRAAGRDPRLVVVTTGASRRPAERPGLGRRKALLDFARERALPVVEDATGLDRQLGDGAPALSALDGTGRVLPLADVADEAGGDLTATAVAAGPKARDRLRSLAESGPPGPDRLAQRVLAAFLVGAGRARTLRTLRERRELMLAAVKRALRRRLPEAARFEFSADGAAVRVDLPADMTGEGLKRAAARRGIGVLSARDCGEAASRDRFVLLDLGALEEGELLDAIREVGAAFDEIVESTPSD